MRTVQPPQGGFMKISFGNVNRALGTWYMLALLVSFSSWFPCPNLVLCTKKNNKTGAKLISDLSFFFANSQFIPQARFLHPPFPNLTFII